MTHDTYIYVYLKMAALSWRTIPSTIALNRASWRLPLRLKADLAKQRPRLQHRLDADRLRYSTSASLPAPLSQILRVSDEVLDAVATNKPVVALESTIYTHGALGNDLYLEDLVRQHGAVPAVCGILDGVPSVGLTPEEVERMVHEGAKKGVEARSCIFGWNGKFS